MPETACLPFVVALLELGLDLLHRLQADAHDDEDRGAAEGEVLVGGDRDQRHEGDERDDAEVEGTGQRDAGEDVVEVLGRRPAGADAELESAATGVAAEFDEDARDHLSAEAYEAARAAAAIMAMNNVYYRSKHLLHDAGVSGYDDIPAKLRMQVIGTSGGVAKADFEFWCFAVSAVNGCGQCLASHEHVLREAGVSRDQINDALRIASVVHAVAVTLESEDALASA